MRCNGNAPQHLRVNVVRQRDQTVTLYCLRRLFVGTWTMVFCRLARLDINMIRAGDVSHGLTKLTAARYCE